eukprot:CAMPEP_0179299520 /NCGR_PEP_ID=MMETSP0797-20121207/46559_1 /TAXON_ID=47934 /ORGANISM="Dinophysis acuminata, Strain DAEP01" /LENGTH=213 /DNA_ID=CAMNT_0021008957 /DNA_START=14 /DNA_END=656 /DNA_ORIENTATION=+
MTFSRPTVLQWAVRHIHKRQLHFNAMAAVVASLAAFVAVAACLHDPAAAPMQAQEPAVEAVKGAGARRARAKDSGVGLQVVGASRVPGSILRTVLPAQPPTPRKPKKVWFDLSMSTLHEITPYSEIYGMHPRDFTFGKDGICLNQDCRAKGDEEDEAEDDANNWVKFPHHFAAARPMPWTFWCVASVLCFLLRVFGSELFSELAARSSCVYEL